MRSILLGSIGLAFLASAANGQTCGGDTQVLSSLANGNYQTPAQSPIGNSVSGPQSFPAGSGGGANTAMQSMLNTAYGPAAVTASNQLGVNPASVAEIGQAESGFRNVPTANGSSSATGPWQITSQTFSSYAPAGASPTDVNAQAQIAPAIVRDYASAVTSATGRPATTLDTYGAWVFGPSGGSQIANASPDTPLNTIVSTRALQNNGMTGWTVGQFRSTMGQRLGPGSNQPAMLNT